MRYRNKNNQNTFPSCMTSSNKLASKKTRKNPPRYAVSTSAAKGSAASWINAGNPIEKNSRVNFFLSFGRLPTPLSPSLSSLLLTTFEVVLVAIHSLLSVRDLLIGVVLRPNFCDDCGSVRPFTANSKNISSDDDASNTRTLKQQRKETLIIICAGRVIFILGDESIVLCCFIILMRSGNRHSKAAAAKISKFVQPQTTIGILIVCDIFK
jgi:hypothetical protein